MNRIYKVIYSKARQCCMVVSELAKSSHKNSRKGAGHVSTPALARIIAAALVAGTLTWGGVPEVSWAAETAENKAGAGIGIAIGDNSKTDTFAQNQIAIGVGAKDVSDGSAPNDAAIAIGAGAHTYNELGRRVAAVSFGKNQKDYTGGIAIGKDTYAITTGTSIGQRDYNGIMGDITVSDSNRDVIQYAPGATSLGSNAYAGGTLATVIGAYNISTSGYNGKGGLNTYQYAVQNFGSTILGTLNTNESATAPTSFLPPLPSYSGIANSLVGVANRTYNTNGAIIMGAGNEITNSVTSISGVSATTNASSVNELADTLRNAVGKSDSGGATLVIGGGNKADYAQKTQILGVNNTVTGTKRNISDYNMIDGFGNTITGASHLYTIGTNNTITNARNTILAGDDYTAVSGLTDSVIIGNNRVRGKDDKAEFAYFSNQKNIVSIGNKNVLDSTDGSISIGNNNFMWRSGGQPEKYGYDTGNVAIGNNTYINSYVNQGDSIVIGKNATVINMGGSLEKAFAFGRPEGKDYSGSIAIGQNTYARSGSTMIGIHDYQGTLGDLDINFTNGKSEGSSGIGNYQESIDSTTIGNNSYNNGVFSTVVGSYTAVSGLYHNQKWGEKPYGVQNFGAAVLGSLNSVEGLTSTEHNTAGMADSILGSANRTKNANGTIMVGAGNVVEDSINDFDATEIKMKDGIASPNALSDAMRTSIKNANGGGAAAIVGNGNEVKQSTNVSVLGSKNKLTKTKSAQVLGDNREVTDAEGAVIIGSASGTTPVTTDKKNVTILGYNANATAEGGVAIGSGSIANTEAGAFGWDPGTNKASTIDSKVWKSSWAAVSVGDGTYTRQITNLAAGLNDTDAVNVAQLKAAMKNATPKIDFVAGEGIQIEKDSTGTTYTIKANITGGTTATDITKVAQKEGDSSGTGSSGTSGSDKALEIKTETNPISFAADEGTAAKVKPSETLGILGDKNNISTKVNGSNITVSLKKDITVDSVKIDGGPSMTVDGIDAGKKKITNVAEGTESSDAVNYGQLQNVENQVTSNTQNINYLNGRVGELGDRINKVGAGAAALAALHPLDFDPDDKWDFAAGVGNYRNATAAAVGLFYRPNERTMFNLGWTMGDNRNMVNGGFSVKFGKSNKYVKYSKAEMASVIDNQSREIAELKAKDAQNAKDNAEMRAEIEALKKQVEALAAKK